MVSTKSQLSSFRFCLLSLYLFLHESVSGLAFALGCLELFGCSLPVFLLTRHLLIAFLSVNKPFRALNSIYAPER